MIVTPAGGERIARSLAALWSQTVAARIELVVVAPVDADLDMLEASGARGRFAAVEVIRVAAIETTGRALAAGFRAARGGLIGCVEEHSYPEPEWAEALLDAAGSGDSAAYGAEMINANPSRALSWAHLFSDFGSAVAPAAPGEATELPGHQTAYPDHVIERYGDRLDEWLEVEWVLHDELIGKGEQLELVPAARVRHLNVSTWRSQLVSEFQGGRAFGASRAHLRRWSPLRRLGYALALPALFVVRLVRSLGDVAGCGRRELLPRLLPALALGLGVNVVGQCCGYLFGPGDCRRRRLSIELERFKHLAGPEREQFSPPVPATDG